MPSAIGFGFVGKCEAALAMSFVLIPVSFVDLSVFVGHLALAMSLVVKAGSFVSAVTECLLAGAFYFLCVLLPFTNIKVRVGIGHSSLAVLLALMELTLISVFIDHYKFARAVPFVFFPHAYIKDIGLSVE